MASTQKSALTSALEESIASIASVFPRLTVEASRQSGTVRDQLGTLHDELRWVFGVLCGLCRLVQYYEAAGQQLPNTNGPYRVLECLNDFFAEVRESLNDITVVSLQSTLWSLEPYLSIVALVCDDAHALSGIHHRLTANVRLQAAIENDPARGPSRSCLKNVPKNVPSHGPEVVRENTCPQGSRPEEDLVTEPCDDDTIYRWLQELNFPGHDRPFLELFPELCLVRARNRQRPLYRVAASQWYRHVPAKWHVIQIEAHRLFSDAYVTNNFNQWVLEFARTRFPDPFECAGQPTRAAKIIELTNELEKRNLTPLHVSSMLGLSELCRHLTGYSSRYDRPNIFGSALYCALMGPQILVQVRQALSWPTILAMMEPVNSDTISTLVTFGIHFQASTRLILETPHAVTRACLGFVASVKARNHEIFQDIMDADICSGEELDAIFSGMLLSLFLEEIHSDLRELIARLFALVLGYNLAAECGRFPWDVHDDVGPAICKLMDRHHLSLPINTIMPIRLTDEEFDTAVRECVLNGDSTYLHRLTLDVRFNANLLFSHEDVEIEKMENGTIVHAVAGGQHYSMLPVLASHGADFSAVDARGRTPLMVVEDVEMLRLLVKEYGASTESTDIDGRNIWHYAAATNDKDIMEWLCNNDPSRLSNINSLTKKGHSPLIESLLYINTLKKEIRRVPPTRPHVAYMLLEEEDLDITRGSAELPIGHIAVQWGELTLVNLLVQKGVNMAVLDSQGRSPLHHLNSSAELVLVRRLVGLCRRLPILSKAGLGPIESLYANSFFAEPCGFFSNHPSCFKAISESMLRYLLTRDILDVHNEAGQGCWARFCSTARDCSERCSQIEGGMPNIVEHSFWSALICLQQNDVLEAHEDETGQSAILSFASFHDDGSTSWSLETNSLVYKTLEICLLNDMTQFLQTQHAFWLFKEALQFGAYSIIEILANEMPLQEPSSVFGGLSVLEYAMRLEDERLLSFHNLFSRVTADQVNSIGTRLCLALFEPSIDMSRREKLSILLDKGLCPNTRIVRTGEPEMDTTILSEAIAHDWSDIITTLLARGADPGLGRTHKAITTALPRSNVDTLSRLIRQLEPNFDWNFTVYHEDKPGFNAIDVAIQAGAHEALDMLFSRTNIKTILHSRSDVNRGTPAHLAAWRSDIKSIRMLRQQGADLARVDDQGRTILHIAAEISSPELADLAAEFCPLDATDSEGRTARDISESNLMVHKAA
ncbi:hypothetical protein E4U21_006772 [Claviceps maximensis]|nr:hypothetical protein E4U21_006772 [Claviceps maximensis]